MTSDERLLRDLSLTAQDARQDGRKTEEDAAHSAINEVLDRKKEEKR